MKMIKVRLLVSRSGNDGAFSRGDEISVPENEVPHMLAAGQCEVVGTWKPTRARVVETAVQADTAEKAGG
jgi:hypothetical protein